MKKTRSLYDITYKRSIKGLITRIYNTQKLSSEKRGHNPIEYSKEELTNWLMNETNFIELYDKWVKSKYDKWLKPSVDRLEDDKGYFFGNIQLVTWRENDNKGRLSQSVPIIQLSKEGKYINKFKSIAEAAKITKVNKANIANVKNHKTRKAGGFKWISQTNP